MTNHPNRRARPPGCDPLPGERPLPRQIRERREAADITQKDAAALVHAGVRSFEDWEAGRRPMPPAVWELFCIKTAPIISKHARSADHAAR
jgi:DNA-binding transcriptional regulator YiaG